MYTVLPPYPCVWKITGLDSRLWVTVWATGPWFVMFHTQACSVWWVQIYNGNSSRPGCACLHSFDQKIHFYLEKYHHRAPGLPHIPHCFSQWHLYPGALYTEGLSGMLQKAQVSGIGYNFQTSIKHRVHGFLNPKKILKSWVYAVFQSPEFHTLLQTIQKCIYFFISGEASKVKY